MAEANKMKISDRKDYLAFPTHLIRTGVSRVTPTSEFRILLDNMWTHPKKLREGKIIVVFTSYPTATMEEWVTEETFSA